MALARALGLSASYLNQIEQNQRPMTVPVLLKINAELGVDVQRFSDDEEARLVAGLCDVVAEQPRQAHRRNRSPWPKSASWRPACPPWHAR